jgi:hypothetical protein
MRANPPSLLKKRKPATFDAGVLLMTAVSLLERKEQPLSQVDGKRLRDIFSMPAHNMETLEP